MTYQESNLLKLLVSGDPYNITLFKEVIQIEYNLSPETCEKVVTQFYFKGDWANYVYVFGDNIVVCSREKMLLQEGLTDESSIVCFSKT
jgi:hypothetical protein